MYTYEFFKRVVSFVLLKGCDELWTENFLKRICMYDYMFVIAGRSFRH